MRTALALLALLLAPIALAADAPAPDRPKSPAAVAAVTKADKAVADAEAAAKAATAKARQQEIDDLKAAQTEAMKGGSLPEANAIDAEIKRVQAEADAAKASVKPSGAAAESATWFIHESTFRYGNWDKKAFETLRILPDGRVVDRKQETRFRWSVAGEHPQLTLTGPAGTMPMREDDHHNFHGQWPGDKQAVVLLPGFREPY